MKKLLLLTATLGLGTVGLLQCAAEASPSYDQAVAQVISCPHCTFDNPAGSKSCEICGSKLNAPRVAPEGARPMARPVPVAPRPEARPMPRPVVRVLSFSQWLLQNPKYYNEKEVRTGPMESEIQNVPTANAKSTYNAYLAANMPANLSFDEWLEWAQNEKHYTIKSKKVGNNEWEDEIVLNPGAREAYDLYRARRR